MRVAHSGPTSAGEQHFPANLNDQFFHNEQAALAHQSPMQDMQPQLEWKGCAAKPQLIPCPLVHR